MASTRIRLSNRRTSEAMTNIFDIPVASTQPSNGEVFAYNATTGYLEPISSTATLPNVSGNKIFEDGVRFSTDGTVLNNVRFFKYVPPLTTSIPTGQFVDVLIPGGVQAGDRIFVTAQSDPRGLNCTRVVDTTVTPNVEYIRVFNHNAATTTLEELEFVIFNI